MFRTTMRIVGVAACLLLACVSLANADGMFPEIVLAPDSTGDFGPQTAGTTTAGWQEAINYCVANSRDLYVKTGANYDIYSTIYVPPCANFKITSEIGLVRWRGSLSSDLIVFDSAKNCNFALGYLYYGGAGATGAAIRIKPQNPVAGESSAAFVDCSVNIAMIQCQSASSPAVRSSFGAVFDTSLGPISNNDFYFTDILNFGTIISSTGSANDFSHNRVKCMDLRSNATNGTIVSLGDHAKQNIVKVSVGVDQSATGVKGVDVSGANNSIEMITKGGFAAASDLIFESAAAGNQVNMITGTSVTDPTTLVTENSTSCTNQLVCTGAPIPMRTIAATVGTYDYTQKLYLATVRLDGGTVSSIRLTHAGTIIDYGSTRSDMLMGVGDQLQITSSVAPNIQIIPVKTK